ncbi:alcohol dehydrogenase catalytic domain-containing protein [Rossellomorea vietnamensis]|uniref:Alcohol dehydrogenase n=1 Tax=Rossellomorea vietnamensis TaxID=218284 RepID=A0A0P6WJT6_9BACI|nr:alcohol dehydrogenase catalytic domain-containing protein [Rossellomorea vietnamensis]KPL60956.1 alcohol dehydrogenase [Rossellomorea vietnamensis]
MKQNSLVLYRKKNLKWTQKKLPPLERDEILVKTIAGAISIGAELPQYMESDKTELSPHYPKETGYESYGEIVEVGSDVKTLKIGDRVVSFFGHKDYGIIKEQKAIPVPKDIHYSIALLTILSCDSAKGVFKINPKETDKVLVTGAGTMGLLTVHFLKEYMNVHQVDMLEPNPSREPFAKLLGVSNVFRNISECPIDFYDYGFECSSYAEAFNSLQKSLHKDAEICILSDGNKDKFELQPEFYEKELKIVGSGDGWDYKKHSEWYFENIKQTGSHLNRIFEYKIGKQKLIECFEDLSKGKINPIKVLVEYI